MFRWCIYIYIPKTITPTIISTILPTYIPLNINKEITIDELKNNISSYVDSSNIINGSDFLAIVLSSDNMEPEEQIKKGISAVDLGDCTQIIKQYYNISDNESFIILNIESKNLENKTREINTDDNSFYLGKNNQIETRKNSHKTPFW